MTHVRLPSGNAIDLTGAFVVPWSNDSVTVDFDIHNEDANSMTFDGDDASALRAWIASLPALKTEAQAKCERDLALNTINAGHAAMTLSDGSVSRINWTAMPVERMSRSEHISGTEHMRYAVEHLHGGARVFTLPEVLRIDFASVEILS